MKVSLLYIKRWLVAAMLLAGVGFTIAINATPRMPEAALAWKNVSLGGNHGAVFCLFRDGRGLMWIGTNSGLYFYDGVGTHAVHSRALGGTQIYAILEHDNTLILGTNNGLLFYDLGTGALTEAAGGDSPREIRTLLMVDNTLFIGSLNGAYTYAGPISAEKDVTAGFTDISEGLPHSSVYALLRDRRGIIYAGTYSGVARRDGKDGRFEEIPAPRAMFANCLLEGNEDGDIYIGTEGALYRYNPATDSWHTVDGVADNNIKSMCRGMDGHLWVGTDDGVFDLSDTDLKHYRHSSRREQSLANNEIWCIYADQDNNIWAGHERGFSIAADAGGIRVVKLGPLLDSDEGNEIHLIHRDAADALWLAGTNGIIRIGKDGSHAWYRHNLSPGSLSHNRIRDIMEDSLGRLWLATDGGINRTSIRPDGRFEHFHISDSTGARKANWVYAITQAPGGLIWTGSFLGGLHGVDKEAFEQGKEYIVARTSLNDGDGRLGNNLVNDMLVDNDGRLWVLLFRDNELTRYDPKTDSAKHYNIHDISGGYPTHIALDSRGRVWCAFSRGAVVFGPGDSVDITYLPPANKDEGVYAMGAVGEDVWLSTHSNLWRFDGTSLQPVRLPLPQKQYTAIFDDASAGRVLLGSVDEVVELIPDSLHAHRDNRCVRMAITAETDSTLRLSDILNGSRGLSLPYGGSISLLVSTLDYAPESVQRYMYKLADNPADTIGGWVVLPEGANTITLSDLRMGSYCVLVNAVGSSASPLSVPLQVAAPWWLSWWAIALYALLILAGVGAVLWYMRRRQRRRMYERERAAALENVEKKLSFLSSISHDLKTPLSLIMGPVSLLKERAKDPDTRHTLDLVYQNSVRLNNMIHRTLELRMLDDADESLLITSTFDVVDFCRGIFEAFKENNPTKNFVFYASAPQIIIEADAVKFESVITNLLSNACKYSDDGATISCGITIAEGCVEIAVSDSGVGIAEDDRQLVFQRMFRAKATANTHEGTGLGLYLIKKYMELMGGSVDLYSRPDQGTTFMVRLPRTEQATLPSQNDEGTDDGKPKILVIEDNTQIATFLQSLLRGKYNCLAAENGRAGLAIAASFLPDLIIADEMMPVMNGLEMVRRLKENPRLRAIPIIMLTAKTDNETESKSIKLGVDAFIGKPFEPSVLMARISQLLTQRAELKERARIQAIAEAEVKPIEAETSNEKALARIAHVIEENIADPALNVNMLCDKCGIPNKQLYRLIKKYMGITPLDYIRRVRLQKAALLLAQQRFTVAEVSYMVGFNTPSYFAKCFREVYGVTPANYKPEA